MKKQLLSLALLSAAWLAGGSALAHDGDHSYTNGICTIEGCTDKYQAPALVDGWYELTNAGNVEWIGDYVKNTAVDPKVKMMNDIDFTGITHTPIGPDAQHKFNGVFDGQGYRIKNLTLSLEESGSNVGFFLWVRGGSTIKNLTFDRTCSFSAKDRAAAFICVLQANSSYPVTIENCVNYANVSSGAKVASGFVAACNWQNDDQPAVNFTNCVNAGTISSTSDKTAAFFGWNKSSNVCTFTNCINIGSLTKIDDTHNLARGNNYEKLSFVNCYDLVNTTAQGKTGEDGVINAPTLDDGYYQLTSAIDVEWFSQQVAKGGDANLQIKGKLMNDIDFLGIENLHSPIGPDTGKKFNGAFDGQGFRIKNMIIERPTTDYQGFFGYLRGNIKDTYVKNLIIDSSCSITGKYAVGGIAASGQNNETFIYIQNCVNEANITATGGDAGGILGSSTSNHPKWIIQNCVNTGSITATSAKPYAGGLTGWMGDNSSSRVENFINIGTINYYTENIWRGSNITTSNLVDLSDTASKTQGNVASLTSDDIANGKLAYYINTQAGSTVFYQTIGTDEYPVPFSTGHSQVYQDYNCDGNLKDSYSNTVDGYHYAHVLKSNGFCENCTLNPVTSLSQDGESFYLISNAAELEYFSGMVETGGQNTAHRAKLTADIDMTGVTHKPIGGGANDSNKFNSTFDGQNHKISNMTSYTRTENVGLFSWVRGGSIIKNLTIDETCSISGTEHVAAFVGKIQAGDNVRFENCINKASVNCTGNHAAAFVAKSFSSGLKTNMLNCGNAGRIQSALNACAFVSWNTGGTIKNCWNVGEIVKSDWDKTHGADYDNTIMVSTLNFFNGDAANNVSLVNTFDASSSEERSQGTLLDPSAAASGELTYKLGGDWCQTIGTNAHPVFEGPDVLYVGDAGYSTFYDASNDWELNGDAHAYIGTINGSALHLDEIDDIPAGTAVVISGTYFNKVSTTATATTTGNVLKGSDGNVTGDGSTIFALANGEKGVGFYPVGDGVTIPAGKAYLVDGSLVKGFTFVFDDDATGIEDIKDFKDLKDSKVIYNVAGQRIQKMQKGINIVNGKKIAVK